MDLCSETSNSEVQLHDLINHSSLLVHSHHITQTHSTPVLSISLKAEEHRNILTLFSRREEERDREGAEGWGVTPP